LITDAVATRPVPAVVCGACGAVDSRLLYRQPAFRVYHCRHCSARFVVGEPGLAAALEAEWAEEASSQGAQYMAEVFERHEAFWLAHWAERVERIESLHPHRGRLLDIGGAMGHFQAAAERRGWQTVGVETSEDQVRYAREHFGLDSRSGRFEEADLAAGSFDAVCLWSVIEHVGQPLAFLEQARALLKPDGVLALQTPNAASLLTWLADAGYRLSGGRFLLGVYSLDHVFRFDAASLRALLERSGFREVIVEPYDNLDVMTLRMSLQPRNGLRRTALRVVHTVAGWIGRPNQLVAYARPAPGAEGGRRP
jgi:2-polyprenyl-3-methyl-5-hydroxy-6-metoxy-1,4-benzoquinol methylase